MGDSSSADGIIGIHLLSSTIEQINLGRSINLLLVSSLDKLGYRTAFIPRLNYNLESTSSPVAVAHFARATRDGTGLKIAKTATTLSLGSTKGAVQAIRARTASPSQLEAMVPVVNGYKLRALGADKWTQYTLLQDYMPKTVLVSDTEDTLPALLEGITTPRVVVKAVNGRDSKLLAIVDKPQVVRAVASLRASMTQKGQTPARIVLQAYQAGAAFTMLRSLAAADATTLSALGRDVAIELRVYCFAFWSKLEFRIETYAVYRIRIGSPAESFVIIDQDSVPDEAFQTAETAARRILEHSAAPGGLIAVDEILHIDGTIGIREINTRDPALAGLVSQDYDFQLAQVGRLVRLLIGLAQSNS